MLTKDDINIIEGIVEDKTVDLKYNVTKLGVSFEKISHKMDIMAEGIVNINDKLGEYPKLQEKVYNNHEIRISALEKTLKK